jgi:hypothetical protein
MKKAMVLFNTSPITEPRPRKPLGFNPGMNRPTLFGAGAQGYPFSDKIFILCLLYDEYLYIDSYAILLVRA